jgi:hypothetical protein
MKTQQNIAKQIRYYKRILDAEKRGNKVLSKVMTERIVLQIRALERLMPKPMYIAEEPVLIRRTGGEILEDRINMKGNGPAKRTSHKGAAKTTYEQLFPNYIKNTIVWR